MSKGNSMSSRVQAYGLLQKRPFGHNSNKWCKRFFIILDGFMLYYPESEFRDFEQKHHVNIHPKGVVPLGGCTIEAASENSHPFIIRIQGEDLENQLVVSAESSYDREKWITKLRESSRITWRNAQFGDIMIQQLESQGLKMAAEKHDYMTRLHEEAVALQEEKSKTEELEKIKEDLEKEKEKTEKIMNEIKEEYDRIKNDFEQTAKSLNNMAEERKLLHQQVNNLQLHLEDLEKVRMQTLDELLFQATQAQQLNEEKHVLSKTTDSLRQKLSAIEEKSHCLFEEKLAAEARLRENENKTVRLEQDKHIMNCHAEELEKSLKEMAEQKALTEAELKAEMVARRAVEQRLQEAENSLARLERALKGERSIGQSEECVKQQMIGDVTTLKKFFENVAFETKLDAQSSVMIKHSINAQKALMRRSQTMRYSDVMKRSRKRTDLRDLFDEKYKYGTLPYV